MLWLRKYFRERKRQNIRRRVLASTGTYAPLHREAPLLALLMRKKKMHLEVLENWYMYIRRYLSTHAGEEADNWQLLAKRDTTVSCLCGFSFLFFLFNFDSWFLGSYVIDIRCSISSPASPPPPSPPFVPLFLAMIFVVIWFSDVVLSEDHFSHCSSFPLWKCRESDGSLCIFVCLSVCLFVCICQSVCVCVYVCVVLNAVVLWLISLVNCPVLVL